MIKSIYFKEYLKTRWFVLIGALLILGTSFYSILRMVRVIKFKGVAHLWEILLSKDVVFIEPLEYIPLFIGILIGVTQFVPEMEHKRMKLTLHLPYPVTKMMLNMLSYGLGFLLAIFIASALILFLWLNSIFAPEFISRILLSAAPWYLVGLISYILTAWVIIEPRWKYRFINILLSLSWIWLFMLPSGKPESGNSSLWLYILLTIISTTFVFISMRNFKEGRQD